MPSGRRLLAGAVVALAVAQAGDALAQRTFKVHIDSEPPGATVIVGNATEPSGETPLDVELPAGDHTVVLVLPKHEDAFETITVKRRRRGVQEFSFELSPFETALIEIQPAEGTTDAEGADIYLDGEKVGTVPDVLDATIGPHQVEVRKQGYRLYEEWIEVDLATPNEVFVELIPLEGTKKDDEEKKDGDGGGGPEGELFEVGAGFELGLRDFRYDNPQSGNLRPFSTNAVSLLRLYADLRPWGWWGKLPQLSLTFRFTESLPITASTDDAMPIEIASKWREVDAGLSYRYAFIEQLELQAEVAYGQTLFYFEDNVILEELPEVDYKFLRILLRLGVNVWKGQVFVGFENHVVFSAGRLAARFDDASVNGFSVHGGGRARVHEHIEVRLLGEWTRYAYDFEFDDASTYRADGGTDKFLTFWATGAYIF